MKNIQQQLEKLRALDSNESIFGSNTHHYQLNPTLSQNEIEHFEQQHNIVLPKDYKDFLLTIGNGGAGPNYGLFKLNEFFTGRHYGSDINIPDTFLSTPFPFSQKRPYFYTDESDETLVKELFGSITLSHEGCGYYNMLIVTGDAAGTVWIDACCSDGGMHLIFDNFTDWYLNWLERSIAEL